MLKIIGTKNYTSVKKSEFKRTTDISPPKLKIVGTNVTYNSVNVTISVNESSTVWCLVEKPETLPQNSALLNSETSSLFNQLTNAKTDPKLFKRIISNFNDIGTQVRININEESPLVQQTLSIGGLVANTHYYIFCYAEDMAEPMPNAMLPDDIAKTMKLIQTEEKVPIIKIVRRVTELRGFKLFVTTDAPGRVWCAAAPVDYGLPTIKDIQLVGVTVDVLNPFQEYQLTVRGVEQNTSYKIYCAAGLVDPNGSVKETSTELDIAKSSIQADSYGRYCETEAQETISIMSEKTPFHPITPDEELAIRDFILAQQELKLEGVYRINTFLNKTEIYDYYDKNGPKPLRYARVRAGRCDGNVGYYEQYRVGPLDHRDAMTYVKIANPTETECGGYNPQGVFGRLLMETTGSAIKAVNQFLQKSFGYEYNSDKCIAENTLTECLTLGPLILEELCDNDEEMKKIENICDDSINTGRLWVGFQTQLGEKLPLYFVQNISDDLKHQINEQPHAWAQRVFKKESYHNINDFFLNTDIWFEGHIYKSIDELTNNSTASKYTPDMFKSRKEWLDKNIIKAARQEKNRRLEPQPFSGAAGTAGPLPTRHTRRGGLEYRAIPEHIEAQGRRFTVEASEDQEVFNINYIGWTMTVTNDRDTALRIYNLRFLNKKVAFEMGLMEALAHYSVSERNWFFLDSWYGGLGAAARRVHKGIECPKTAVSLFFDGSLCVFEQDMARPIRGHWKAGELRDGAPHTSLVFRQMLTVSNYDYVTDYRFHSSGMFEGSVSFTGELYAGVEVPWYSARQQDYGVQVTGAMRFAALHSHMAVWKIDFDIGEGDEWQQNSVLLTEIIPDSKRRGANKLKRTIVENELEAAYFRNDSRAIVYEVVNENIKIFGNIGGYRVIPSPGINPLHHDFDLYLGPAAWAKYRAASTVRKYAELDSTLPRDNKFASKPAISLDRYLLDNETVRNVDVVTWIADGLFHVPVIEDMPLTIPIGNTLGWLVKPSNLYLEDPTMDLHNAMGGGVQDPGTCAVVRLDISEVESILENTWKPPVSLPVQINVVL